MTKSATPQVLKVLLVDDEVEITRFISSIIAAEFPNSERETSSNGEEAFLKCQIKKYDIIITDHNMPKMTGTDFIVALKSKANANRTTPVLMLSGFIDSVLRIFLRNKGIAFVDKPVDVDKLVDELRKFGISAP